MRNRSHTYTKRQPVQLSTLPKLRTKVWLERDGAFVIGEGGLDLLNAIDRMQSLTHAARAVGWSYRHAWGYLRNAEQQLGVALVVTSPGKGSERGTMLSVHGRTVFEAARACSPRCDARCAKRLAGVVRPDAAGSAVLVIGSPSSS